MDITSFTFITTLSLLWLFICKDEEFYGKFKLLSDHFSFLVVRFFHYLFENINYFLHSFSKSIWTGNYE